MYTGQFDTDQTALQKRISVNSNDFNLEEWIFSKLPKPTSVLDLGCGSGKQTRYILEHYPDCRVVAVDKSKDYLPGIKGYPKLMRVQCDFDNLPFKGPAFDLVLSVYSFYYSSDMAKLLERAKQLTKHGGKIMLVGPGRNNNIELMQVIEKHFPGRFNIDQDFIETEGEQFRAYNPVRFESPYGVGSWWKNHNTFDQEIFDVIKDEEITTLTKSILAIRIDV